jgi:stage IV sporulation protein FB
MKIRTGGIIWEISFPLAAVMTLVVLYDSSLSVTACFISVLIHEMGHILVMAVFGKKPERIKLTLFDFAIVSSSKGLLDLRREMAVILAGVCANFTAALFGWVICSYGVSEFAEKFMNTNLSLAFFNIMPIESLDGGQAFTRLLCSRIRTEKAFLISDIVSVIFIVPLGTLGFIVLIRTGYNFSVLLTAVYLASLLIMKEPHKFGRLLRSGDKKQKENTNGI